jgi:hypothetical protein
MGRFLKWNADSCALSPRLIRREKKASILDADTLKAGNAAEKIGEWFAGDAISDICVYLGVKLS